MEKWRQGYQTHLYIYGDHTLLVIELKATPNGNPSDGFYWRQKSSSLNVVQYNTTSRPIIIHLQIYSLTGKYNQPGYVGVRPRSKIE